MNKHFLRVSINNKDWLLKQFKYVNDMQQEIITYLAKHYPPEKARLNMEIMTIFHT